MRLHHEVRLVPFVIFSIEKVHFHVRSEKESPAAASLTGILDIDTVSAHQTRDNHFRAF